VTIEPITITFPTTRAEPTTDNPNRRVPVTQTVQWTGELKKFSEIRDGEIFLDGDEVFEKLGNSGDVGQLHPWGDSFLFTNPYKLVGVLKTLSNPRFK
jgi:hypothetical protein